MGESRDLAIETLQLMSAGKSAEQALEAVLAQDDARELRQIGAVDWHGQSAAWSGSGCTPWFGHITEKHVAVQGNMLVSAETIEAMAKAFLESQALGLAERLLLALEAGQAGRR